MPLLIHAVVEVPNVGFLLRAGVLIASGMPNARTAAQPLVTAAEREPELTVP